MFESLTNSFNKIVNKISGSKKINAHDLEEVLSDIRNVLIDSDVALSVVKDFIGKIKAKALGQEIIGSVTAGQMIIKIINDELVNLLKAEEESELIKLDPKNLNSILMIGLQGSGKTTSSAKLALWLKKQGKKVLLISTDVYRAAARSQLKILSQGLNIDFFESDSQDAIEIAKSGLKKALEQKYNVAIFDTAGRIQIDNKMIDEAKEIKNICKPCETLLVMDSLAGQDAINVALEFHKNLNISGSILTRVDADNKGGAALSIKTITQKPIKFLGTGEKTDALEMFDPKRIANRILGMGDIVSLVEKASSIISKTEAEKSAQRLQKGQFNLEDYLDQIKNLNKMGGLNSIMKLLPSSMSSIQNKAKTIGLDDSAFKKQEAIINAMTKKERKNPDTLNKSRKKRIAEGSGLNMQEIEKLLKQFMQMQDIVKKASKMNLSEMMSKTGIDKLFS